MNALTLAAGLAAAFVLLPQMEALSLPWVMRMIGQGYGWGSGETVRLVWRCLLALLIFAVVRGVLSLVLSAVGLALIMSVFSGRRRRMRR